MPLELDSLKKAVSALKRAVNSANENLSAANPDLRDTIKAGVVQNFEVSYEQCWKFMQRWIRENRTPEEADPSRTRKELFRMAARYELIPDPLPWFEFGEARNLTTHTYDAAQAGVAYGEARRFLPHAEEFLKRMEERND